MILHNLLAIALFFLLFVSVSFGDSLTSATTGCGRREIRAFELHAWDMPQGMLLLYLDNEGNLLAKLNRHENKTIYRGGTLYGAFEAELSAPFSLQNDMKKLIRLKSISNEELPVFVQGRGAEELYCEIMTEKAGGYRLACGPLPVVKPVEPILPPP